jgi:hypothetical protein
MAWVLVLGMLPACGGSSDSKGKGKLKAIKVTPSPVILRDQSATISLEVTGITTTGRRVDLSADPSTVYASLDMTVATVTPVGVVVPQGEGVAQVAVQYPGFSETVDLYSDFTPDLTAGDFDLVAPDEALKPGSKVTVPVLLETGGETFGSFRAKVTYDPTHLELVKVIASRDLGEPMAIRSDTPGEVEVTDTYKPSAGQSLTGTVEVARAVFRAIGPTGTGSVVTGEAMGVSDSSFPARPIGDPTPRPFVTGKRWVVIR